MDFFGYLFPTQSVTFSTPYTVESAVERLRGAITPTYPLGWLFGPMSLHDVALGRVDANAVRLQRVGRLYTVNPKPAFRGAFRERDGHVQLVGSFEVAPSAKAGILVWLSAVALFTLFSLLFLAQARTHPYVLIFPLVGLLFFAGGVGFFKFCWRMSRRDIDFLRSVIANALA